MWNALKTKTKLKSEATPFVITHDPSLPNIAQIINKHSNILYSSERCSNVFKDLPMVAFRRCSNISDFLVRAKLDTDLSKPKSVSFRQM